MGSVGSSPDGQSSCRGDAPTFCHSPNCVSVCLVNVWSGLYIVTYPAWVDPSWNSSQGSPRHASLHIMTRNGPQGGLGSPIHPNAIIFVFSLYHSRYVQDESSGKDRILIHSTVGLLPMETVMGQWG